MTIENPYVPPNYGMVNVAIERRIAAEQTTPAKTEETAKPKGKVKKNG